MRTPARLLPALLLVFLALAARTENASNLLTFANALAAEEDHYRAITEYKRFLHLFPDDPAAPHVRLAIGMAYFRGGKWEAAGHAFRQAAENHPESPSAARAGLMTGEAAYRSGDWAAALDAFDAFLQKHPADPLAPDARLRKNQCLLLLGRPPLPAEKGTAPADPRTTELDRQVTEAAAIPAKSPALAGSLSALVPGSGQLYVGRKRDAAISFILNGALIGLTALAFEKDEPVAGGVLAAVELSWYSGNIYGAVNGAHKYNRDRRRNFAERLDFHYGIMRDADNVPAPAAGISIRF